MKSNRQHMEAYVAQLKDTLSKLPEEAIDRVIAILLEGVHQGSQVFIFGNGGSAATASHFACDLAKNTLVHGAPGFRVISLVDNMSLMTAWANDTSYDNVFAAQLNSLVKPGDIVIGISCSGNSANVLNALAVGRRHRATTIGFTGDQGGRLKEIVDVCIQAPSPDIEQQEDVHLILEHCICSAIREELGQRYAPTCEQTVLTRPQLIAVE